MPQRILLLNGPNLGELGRREPAVYGKETLADVERACAEAAAGFQLELLAKQSNHEGQLIDWIHEPDPERVGVVINPGGLAHTSVVLRDAIAALSVPVVEVHISNVHKREEFRHHSYLAPVVTGVIAGLGTGGYVLAVEHLGRLAKRSRVTV
ncbi:MAG: type II 3-dehydroquinate dehydratase [Segniliparus sp.]|uniref:type II 3-dehydroquinate dehydratase n=1 Tax=Segniliparus sp. TaxID=2804064 RepID=UPI003F36B513